MAVQNSTSKVQYTLSAAGQSLSVPFYFLEDSHLKVISTPIDGSGDVTLTLDTDYTVSGEGNEAGGSVAMVAGVAGDIITIKRNVPETQLVDYNYNGRFPSETHEKALDKLTMIVQAVSEILTRCFRLPESATPAQEAAAVIAEGTDGYVFTAGADVSGAPGWAPVPSTTGEVTPFASKAALKANSTLSVGAHAIVLGEAEEFELSAGAPSEAAGSYQGVELTNAASATQHWKRLFKGAINVDWFGCAGDGSTDDTIPFTAALTYAKSLNRASLELGQNKNYVVGGLVLTSASNIHIKGNGSRITAALTSSKPTAHILTLNGCTNVRVDGVTFDHGITDQVGLVGRSWTVGVDDYSVIKVSGGEDIDIKGCRFLNSYKAGVSFDSTDDTYDPLTIGRVIDCTFDNCYMGVEGLGRWAPDSSDPWYLNRWVDSIIIEGCSFRDSYTEGIDMNQPVRNISIVGNNFIGCYIQGSTSYRETIDVGFCENIVISGNLIDAKNQADAGISLKTGVERATVTGNVICNLKSAPNGSTWATSTAYTTSNVVNDGVKAYKPQAGYTSGASVSADVANGDLVEYIIGHGILLSEVGQCTISGNTINGARNGIVIDGNGPGDGVLIDAYETLISSNVFKRIRLNGIHQINQSRNEATTDGYGVLRNWTIAYNIFDARHEQGTADGGSTTTLQIQEPSGSTGASPLQPYDDWFNGCEIEIIGPSGHANEGQVRTISDYAIDSGTGVATVTVSSAFPAAIDNTNTYRIKYGQGWGIRLPDLQNSKICGNTCSYFEKGGFFFFGQTTKSDFADVAITSNTAYSCYDYGFSIRTGTRIQFHGNRATLCGTDGRNSVRNKLYVPSAVGTGYSGAYAALTTTGGSGTGLLVDIIGATQSSITPTTGGSSYTTATDLSVTTDGDGSGMTVDITASAGAVTSFDITNAGKGYAAGDTITFVQDGASGGTYVLTAADLEIGYFKVRDPGEGYAASDVITFGGGSSGTYTLTADDVGSVGILIVDCDYCSINDNYASLNEDTGFFLRDVDNSFMAGNLSRGGTSGDEQQVYGFRTDSDCGTLEAKDNFAKSNGTLNFDYDHDAYTGSQTIASGVITLDSDERHAYMLIDEEGGAADSLTTINGGFEGQLLTLAMVDSDYTITVTDGAGIRLPSNRDLTHQTDTITLIKTSGVWCEVAYANNA